MEIKHFSHEHPLNPCEINDEEEDEIICSCCLLEVSPGSSAFKCTKKKCDFILHKPCSELPKQTRHPSHPDHPLTLHSTPPYIFNCHACCNSGGGAFVYNCYDCHFDLHVQCVALAESIEREDHCHPLNLVFSLPPPKLIGDNKESDHDTEKEKDNYIKDDQEKERDYEEKEEAPNEKEDEEGEKEVEYYCYVCESRISKSYWAYFCSDCDYGVHLECATTEAEEEVEEEDGNDDDGDDDEIVKNMRKIAVQQMMINNQRTRMLCMQQFFI
ncbi:hypothetical protein CsatB_014824 [Cannabis sativa]|uniref:DC1 domain-containing protein n=1 Tax=Cannabis sativa TaxID=3483 RepID=A0A7J6HSS6_CANSA|nr:protein VACUOLELESS GAMETOPHYTES [Cannabis sativa]KAF4397728.1 hypothetical protein G4B88_027597 [Cannabis sativa]